MTSDVKYGSLTFVETVPLVRYRGYFKCDCGVVKSIRIDHVKRGSIRSCGCISAKLMLAARGTEIKGARENGKATVEYTTWKAIRQRCLNVNNRAYHYYGGRGIGIDKRWDKFENFLSDMGKRPRGKYSIERINNDESYSPSNCKWATQAEQTRNRRTVILVNHNGVMKPISVFARDVNIKPSRLLQLHSRGKSTEQLVDMFS